jgi:hypothetical protein
MLCCFGLEVLFLRKKCVGRWECGSWRWMFPQAVRGSLSFPMIDNEVCSCGVSRLEVEVEVEVRFTREVAAVSDDG